MDPEESPEQAGPDSRVQSTASFMSIDKGGPGLEPNGYAAGPGSPSKLSDELARRLVVEDRNPSQPQVSPGWRCVCVCGGGGGGAGHARGTHRVWERAGRPRRSPTRAPAARTSAAAAAAAAGHA